ncbi:MAG: DUF4177 domain-containing protein [Emticicia sp.]|uniref:DUF4177 domain-containing protein n=1 Tax=Emticicia sp. TaxID=1930953 RepID=UPI003BA73B36
MKDAKVEVLMYGPKLTLDEKYIQKDSQEEIQSKLSEYYSKGYQLAHTNTTEYSGNLYIYLYFEKIV